MAKFITPAINTRKNADKRFNACLGTVCVGIFAYNLKTAIQLAIEHFKPKKKERHQIEVQLVGG